MTVDRFARAVAKTMEGRETMLKIQCMNLYEIEENSRPERLTEFKRTYRKAVETLDACLAKFFPRLSAGERSCMGRILTPVPRCGRKKRWRRLGWRCGRRRSRRSPTAVFANCWHHEKDGTGRT
ncbi:MAG: hypothetical protein ACTTKW_08460 [Schwartzia sp. (in: firmicutes)]